MSFSLRRKQFGYTVCIALSVLIFLWSLKSINEMKRFQNPKITAMNIIKTEGFYKLKKTWFLTNCLKENFEKMSLEFLPEYIHAFENSELIECRKVAKLFDSMFELEKTYSDVNLNEKFAKKVLGWLDNNQEYLKQAHHQKIIKLYNKFTNEEMIFNPLRGKRPIKKSEFSDKTYTFDLIEKSKQDCDFCGKYQENTAADMFDRIETDLSYTAANTFKYDKWHSLILSRNHNTMKLSEKEFLDMFNMCLTWFKKINKLDLMAKYPEMIWDSMPKAGASQIHPHLQVSMGSTNYYGGMRRWLDAAMRYTNTHQRNFFDDFILIHKALGLTYKVNNVYVIANLIPIKEQELILIGSNTQESYNSISLLLHQITQIFINDFEQYSWSMAMYLPEYSRDNVETFFDNQQTGEDEGYLKRIFCRIVFRTPVANLRSDINGLDLYTSSVLGIDRYTIATKLFKKLNQIGKK